MEVDEFYDKKIAIDHSKLREFIQAWEKLNGCKFKPTRDFYESTKTNQRQWGMIWRDEKSMTVEQAQLIAHKFRVETKEVVTI